MFKIIAINGFLRKMYLVESGVIPIKLIYGMIDKLDERNKRNNLNYLTSMEQDLSELCV